MKIKISFLVTTVCALGILAFRSSADKPSEMAKLMRQMMIYIEKERMQIEADKPMLKFPTDIVRLNKAKITPGKKLSKDHAQYTSAFFESLGNYYQSNEMVERKQSFNVVVKSCITCHERECPGPIQRIEKSLIP